MYIPSYYKMFYFVFEGEPQKTVPEYKIISTGFIQCFIRAENEKDAIEHAVSDIRKNKWNIKKLHMSPIEITEDSFLDVQKDNSITKSVSENGAAYQYIGISRDGKSYDKPFEFERNATKNYKAFFDAKRKMQNRKICLHFNAGIECNEIIKSHSIQNHHQLNVIARNSHVYTINSDNMRRIGLYTLKGINEMSTFQGFCGKHDNEVFHQIDDYPFSDTNEQAMLYAYRAVCKEVYEKQNALQLLVDVIDSVPNTEEKKDLGFHMIGQQSGLCSVNKLKTFYDDSLRNKCYTDAHYILFTFEGKMNVVFSSLIEPEYDFSGNCLQDMSDLSKDLQIITYSSVWISDNKWGFLFSWHQKHDNICLKYIKNLLQICQNTSDFSDYLFRLTVICENSAFSPSWWDSLNDYQRTEMTDYFNHTSSLFAELSPNYLKHGLKGICNWNCVSVKTNVEELKKIIKCNEQS